MSRVRLYAVLATAGVVPFAAWALLRLMEIDLIPVLGHVDLAGTTYAALIIAFLAGSHWGNTLHSNQPSDCRILWISNLVMLSAWVSLVMLPFGVLQISVYIISLVVLLLVDLHLLRNNQITESYYTTRLTITGLVIMLLFVTGVTYGTRY
ncbi:hypothetical protein EOPP23_10590 [Endozoicomonas sp. OPT23]|uniref:DUF3429 domain-containing protein n=1 Tax=Endozoicomonas sp. OPT23 TaxID=2072845 RepID=UPI00129BC42C|nr:DUF3429 domain-containing protein [Endozoicomonas sp. OPT23]MRI33432.1 hypothetical protein [Endozoicomonas sp. OPT23]